MDEPKNYANEPVSITELRSDRTDSAADWTPRDVLISLLREIDAGKLNMHSIICAYAEIGADGVPVHHHSSSSPNTITTLGLLSRSTFKIQRAAEG